MKLYTIGFTKTTAECFFTRLMEAGVKRVIDVRLNNSSQLAGFAKMNDLMYFLRTICGIDYVHLPLLAPTQDIFNSFKKDRGDWSLYEQQFFELMEQRCVEKTVCQVSFDDACLLCSEDIPQHCHRRLVAEYLREKWGNVDIVHL